MTEDDSVARFLATTPLNGRDLGGGGKTLHNIKCRLKIISKIMSC
jgi:hypothetical protein